MYSTLIDASRCNTLNICMIEPRLMPLISACVCICCYSSYTNQVDTSKSSNFVATTGRQAINQLLQGEIDIAIILTEQVASRNPAVWQTFLSGNSLRILPYAIVSASPIFSLPAGLVALACTVCATCPCKWPVYGRVTLNNDRAQHGDDTNEGLLLDYGTVALIFSGYVTSWSDPRILQFNPWIAERLTFATATGVAINTNITIVMSDDAIGTALRVLSYGLNQTIPLLLSNNLANTTSAQQMGNWVKMQ